MQHFVRSISITLILFGSLFLGACSSFKPQAYNKEANANIQKVAVLPMPEANVRLFVFNAVGYNFGLIGTLITEANRNGKENWLQAKVKEADFNQFELFKATLTDKMAALNYELTWPAQLTLPNKQAKRDKNGLLKKYGSVSNADAQLDIGVNYVGYAAAGSGKGQPYRPTVLVTVRLLDASGKKVLYQDQFLHHNVFDSKTAVVIEPDRAYSYPTFDDLEKADMVAIDGLKGAVEKTAAALAEQLK
jgi:hypothetical protein